MRSRWVMGVGAGLTLLAALVLLVVPTYTTSTSGAPGPDATATLLEVNGPGALVPLVVAVVLALGAWAAPRTWLRWTLVGLYGAGCVLSLLSIGLYFLPGGLALATGAALAQGATRGRSPATAAA